MANENDYRAQAEALLRQASATDNMKQRGELIDQAMYWHNLAMDAHQDAYTILNDNEDDESVEARA
jgi:hypothetical protein